MLNIFRRRKRSSQDVTTDPVVDKLKEQTHQKIQEAQSKTDNLYGLLKQNGITFKIHLATGGKHAAHK